MFNRRKELEAYTRLDPDPLETLHVQMYGHSLMRKRVFKSLASAPAQSP